MNPCEDFPTLTREHSHTAQSEQHLICVFLEGVRIRETFLLGAGIKIARLSVKTRNIIVVMVVESYRRDFTGSNVLIE